MSQEHLTTGEPTSIKSKEKGGRGKGREIMPFGLYALELSDCSMMPLYQPGTIFIFEQRAFDKIKNGDLVVYCDSDKRGHFRQIEIGQETITLRGLNPVVSDMVLSKEHIKKCDPVIDIQLPCKVGEAKQEASQRAPIL
jgi:hypothetical protein